MHVQVVCISVKLGLSHYGNREWRCLRTEFFVTCRLPRILPGWSHYERHGEVHVGSAGDKKNSSGLRRKTGRKKGQLATYSVGWEDADYIHLALDSNQWRILVKNLMNNQREEEFMQLGEILVLNKDFSMDFVEILTKIPNHGLNSSSPHLCWVLLVCPTQNDIIYQSTLLFFWRIKCPSSRWYLYSKRHINP